MRRLNSKRLIRALFVFAVLIVFLLIALFISLNFIVDPLIYWLASTEVARAFIACIVAWLGMTTLFDLFYQRYKRRIKNKRSNALNVPYPRQFRGRK